jgi:hypothetical protein
MNGTAGWPMHPAAPSVLEPVHPRARRRERLAAVEALVAQHLASVRRQRQATTGWPGRQNAWRMPKATEVESRPAAAVTPPR